MTERSEQIVKASWIGIIANFVLAFAKIVAGFISGSLAVIGDGIDSATDILTYVITLVAAKIVTKQPNPVYPYGYKRAETVATNILALVIFFVGAELLISSATKLFTGDSHGIPSEIAVYVTILSIAGKSVLAFWQFGAGKKTGSSMLIANAKNMKNDVLISSAILVGLILTYIYRIPQIDLVLAILVSIWILKVAVEILLKTNRELMDGLNDTGMYHQIIEAVEETEGAVNPHRIRIRKHSYMYVIGLDIEVDPGLTVQRSHDLSNEVQRNIYRKVDNVYDIMVHIEPKGNIEKERFGISKETFKN